MKKDKSSTKTTAAKAEFEELSAITEPISKKERVAVAIIIAFALIIVSIAAFLGIRYAVFCKNIKSVSTLLNNTLKTEIIHFDTNIVSQGPTTRAQGYVQSKGGEINAVCDIDFGNRIVSAEATTLKNDAYISLESGSATEYLHTSVNALRYIAGKSDAKINWDKLLNNISQSDTKLSEYYNTSKLDKTVEKLRNQLSSPYKLKSFTTCTKSKNTYTININTYKLMEYIAKEAKDVFANENAYNNFKTTIEEQREALTKQSIKITLVSNGSKLSLATISTSITGQQLDITTKFLDSDSVKLEIEINPELCTTVSLGSAYNRILRSGLDTEAAYKASKQALNEFVEKYSYEVQTGTLIILTDTFGNKFQYVYNGKKNKEISYEDELYNAYKNNTESYIMLSTSSIKIDGYTLSMYEPATTRVNSENYNYAFLAATEAMQKILNGKYNIPSGAVFVVVENKEEFQFTYQENSLYDVKEQYYYYAYQYFAPADLSSLSDFPKNVTLYIPNTSDK